MKNVKNMENEIIWKYEKMKENRTGHKTQKSKL